MLKDCLNTMSSKIKAKEIYDILFGVFNQLNGCHYYIRNGKIWCGGKSIHFPSAHNDRDGIKGMLKYYVKQD